MSTNEDQADVARVLAGEIAAFEGIVRRWQTPLINLAYRFCRDRSRAEDMAQEAFLRAYRGLPKWRGDSAFSTWLFTLATNLYRSELRRIPARNLPLEDVVEPRDPRAIDGGLEEMNRDQAIRRAVDTLPPKYREALICFYFQEMDVPTAAAGLGIAEGTLKARLFRGRKMLESKLPSLLEARRTSQYAYPKETA
jgi:RNA polymerase sigma-70 factor (ECF subfamily)